MKVSWGATALLPSWLLTFFGITLHPEFQLVSTALMIMLKLSQVQYLMEILIFSYEL